MELLAKVSTQQTGSPTSSMLLHKDVYSNSRFRKNMRVSLQVPATPKPLSRRKARALGRALMEKGQTIQLKKTILQEEHAQAEVQELKAKPDINVASQRILKKKAKRIATSQPATACASPSCRYNSPAKAGPPTGAYNSVQATVELSTARVYQAILNQRKAQYCRRMLK